MQGLGHRIPKMRFYFVITEEKCFPMCFWLEGIL